jgi:4-hydroxybenzoate polyprenyltransferase
MVYFLDIYLLVCLTFFFLLWFIGVKFVKREADDEGKKKSNGKSSVSTKRSRAAAIHNQSERVCSLSLSLSFIRH